MPSQKDKIHPALSYSLRITAIVFVIEFLIMVFLMELAPAKNELYKAVLDSVLLVLLLSPAFYAFVYLPILREMKNRIRAQEELENTYSQLRTHAEDVEKRLAEKMEELKGVYAQYATMLEMSNDMIMVANTKMEFTFWNRLAAEEFGYGKEDIIGKNTLYIVPEKYREAHVKGFKDFISNRVSRGRLYHVEGLRHDGTLLPVEVSVSSYESNKEIFVIAILRNVTERIRAEERIRKQLEQLSALRTIDLAITSSLDLQVTLAILLDQITSVVKTGAVDILLLDQVTGYLEYHAGRGFPTNSIKHSHLSMGEGYAGRSALEQRTIHIPDLTDEKVDFLRPELIRDGFISYSCVPLIVKKEVKGVIELFLRAKTEPDPEFLAFFEAIALQAAIAIDNASLFNNLYRRNMELNLAYENTIEGWSRALDLRDKETEGHSRRVTEMTVNIARVMGVEESELVHIRRGALLHDIGKMGIPDAILLKPGPLTDKEWEIMQKHPVYGYELLSPIDYLRNSIDIPYCHHERWDGTGYPRRLKKDEIPLCARIFAVVDIWDALTSERPYRPAWPLGKAREHLKSLSGTHLDPKIVEIFLDTLGKAESFQGTK